MPGREGKRRFLNPGMGLPAGGEALDKLEARLAHQAVFEGDGREMRREGLQQFVGLE